MIHDWQLVVRPALRMGNRAISAPGCGGGRFLLARCCAWRPSDDCDTMCHMGAALLSDAIREFDRVLMERDRSAAERILDEEFALVLVQPIPAFMPRERWLAVLKDYLVHSYDVEEQRVDEEGGVGAVLSRVRMQATVLGQDRSGLFVITDIWRRRGDEWRVWRRHSSPLSAGELPGVTDTSS